MMAHLLGKSVWWVTGAVAIGMLLLGVVLFVALVLVPALQLDEGLRKMLLVVCMESTAFLLAMKILIRKQPHRNSLVAVALLGALALIMVKEFVSTPKTVNFVAAPAVAPNPRPVNVRVSATLPPLPRSQALR